MNQSAVSHQTGSGQDLSVVGSQGNVFWGAVFDGHGSNTCIDHIRTIDMNAISAEPNPILAMAEKIISVNTHRSGATACFVRREGNKIELFNAGDSSAILYVNGIKVLETTKHTFLNPSEIERTKLRIMRIKQTKAPFPVSDDRVEDILSPTGIFINNEELVPSMALGHNGITGLEPEHLVYYVNEFDKVRIVIMSDGASDMLVPTETGTAANIADEALRRWNKQWLYKYMHGSKEYEGLTTYGGCIDDISCVVMEDCIKERPSLCIPYSPKAFLVSHVQECMESVLGGVGKVEIVEHETHNVFFIHFNPAELNDVNINVFKSVLAAENIKIAYNESWWWPIKLMHGSQPLQGVSALYDKWDKVGSYHDFKESHISDNSVVNMVDFLKQFQ
jgi:serine/threonine protein phosphatase PrpC